MPQYLSILAHSKFGPDPKFLRRFTVQCQAKFWPLRNFWRIIFCQLFCFSEQRNKAWQLLFWYVSCKL